MKFSVIIPIYNSGKYLSTTIESVINQDYPLNNIRIILINDGSTDNSEKICHTYLEKFPDTIIYRKINNSGPSVARNIGLSCVPITSDYVVFLDADDKLSLDYLNNACLFFTANPTVNIAVSPIIYFGRVQGEHKLNYRFSSKNDRVIDITREYNSPHFYIGGTIFRTSVLNDLGLTFRSDISFFEDAFFVNQFILSVEKYGLIKNSKYFYRKREEQNSLVDINWEKRDRYIPLLKKSYSPLLKLSIEMDNNTLPYMSYLIIYHLRLFLISKNYSKMLNVLEESEVEEFIYLMRLLLGKIEDKYILNQNFKTIEKKVLLKVKYGKQYDVNKFSSFRKIIIEKLRLKYLYFQIEGTSFNREVFVKYKNKIIPCTIKNSEELVVQQFAITTSQKSFKFIVDIPWYISEFELFVKENEEITSTRKVNLFTKLISTVKKELISKSIKN
ncbi:glycosyltransferase family 2 protein [Cytobacillus sp. FSL K6-0265]|uniref:glycosyltransferase family 2 protein n=1 Tax=Cytobacillus sp. FSL K6-0265 TaxID=2921448 RepID=UPI0030FBEEA6